MLTRHRKTHSLIWLVLAIGLPALLVFGQMQKLARKTGAEPIPLSRPTQGPTP